MFSVNLTDLNYIKMNTNMWGDRLYHGQCNRFDLILSVDNESEPALHEPTSLNYFCAQKTAAVTNIYCIKGQ